MFYVGLMWPCMVLLSAAVTITYYYLSCVNEHWEKLGVPCPKPELFFGNFRNVFFVRECLPTALHRIYRQLEGQPFAGFYVMMTPSIIIRDTKLINRVLVQDFVHFHDRMNFPQFKVDPLTQHLFVVGGQLWKDMRLRMSTPFSVSHTRRVFFLMKECCARLQDSVQATVKDRPSRDLELKQLLSSFTTDVIGSCAFGIECGAIDDVNSQFSRIGSMIFQTTTVDAFCKIVIFTLPKVATFFGMKFFSSSVAEFFDRIVMETFQYRINNGILRDDLIHLMMKLKQNGLVIEENGEKIEITDKMLVAHMLLAFGLGFEMTSSTMSFCLHELSLNPGVQTKARKEVDKVICRHGGELSYEAIKEMTYLDMVVAETLRLYPPLGYLTRQCTEPYQMPGSGLVLQQGAVVYVPVLALHREPRYFPDPLRFDPERFRSALPPEAAAAYMPFGGGPRTCLGQTFALVEVKAGLAALLSRFEFRRCLRSSGSPAALEPRKVITAPAGGLWVRVAPRTWLPVAD